LKGSVKAGSVLGTYYYLGNNIKMEPGSYDILSGNTLNVITPASGGIVVDKYLGGFEKYRFTFDASAPSGSIGLNVGTIANLNDNFKTWNCLEGGDCRDLTADEKQNNGFNKMMTKKGAVIETVDFLPGQIPEVGYEVVLMQADTIGTEKFDQESVLGLSGVNLEVDYGLAIVTSNPKMKLIATVSGLRAHPQMQSPSQGRTAGMAFVTQGLEPIAKRLADPGLPLATAPSGRCPSMYFLASAGRSEYGGTGEFALNSYAGQLGVDCAGEAWSGRLAMGGFVDFALGEFATGGILGGRQVRGEGQLRRLGGGILARFEPGGQGPLSFDGSLRFGKLRQDYSSGDFLNSQNSAKFATESLYVAGHLGFNAKMALSEETSLDFHGRYSHLWLQGDQTMVDGTAPVTFEDSVSMSARAGVRLTRNFTPKLGLKLGLAYDHEFGSTARATTSGYRVGEVSVRGGTGVAELGLNYQGDGPRALSFGLSLEGYAGVRRGLAGGVNLSLAF
jgi:hypothetical protein